jgi:hypothetical protein
MDVGADVYLLDVNGSNIPTIYMLDIFWCVLSIFFVFVFPIYLLYNQRSYLKLGLSSNVICIRVYILIHILDVLEHMPVGYILVIL